MKLKCESCGKNNAEWCYMPKSHYLCDNCIIPDNPDYKGCSCNWNYVDVNAYYPPLGKPELPEGEENKDWKWVEKDVCWQQIDDKGRPLPCCEYEFSQNGWDESTFELLERLDNKDNYIEALDIMNHYFNNWLSSGCYDMVNGLIDSFIKQNYSLDLNLNLLLLVNKHKANLDKVGNGRLSLFDFTKEKWAQTVPNKDVSTIDYLA